MNRIVFLFLIGLSGVLFAQNTVPQISNVRATFNPQDSMLTVDFELADAENDSIGLRFFLSNDGGQTYRVNVAGATGNLGFPQFAGSQQLSWRAPGPIHLNLADYRVKLVAWDRQPIDIQALVDQVDSTRLRRDLQFIAQERTASTALPHLQAVKDSIEARFEAYGLQTRRQGRTLPGGYAMENILGKQSGLLTPENLYLLDAHFDGVPGTEAADDNGSGVVAFLEIARILSQYEYASSLQFIGFDQEEAGLLGSQEYVANGTLLGERIEGLLNFEMIGYYDNAPNSQRFPPGFNLLFPQTYNQIAADSFRGNFITNVANVTSNPLRLKFDSCAAAYVPDLIVRSIAVPGNGQIAPDLRRSDHAPFWDRGIQALMLTDGSEFRNANYHTPSDSLGTLNFTFMRRVTQAGLATAASLARPLHASAAIATIDSVVLSALPPHFATCGLDYRLGQRTLRFSLQDPACRAKPWRVRLYSLQGQLIQEKNWPRPASQLDLNLDALSPGIYLWRVDGEGEAFEQKVLVR